MAMDNFVDLKRLAATCYTSDVPYNGDPCHERVNAQYLPGADLTTEGVVRCCEINYRRTVRWYAPTLRARDSAPDLIIV